MEEIHKYENKGKLYQFLIEDFGLIKTREKYDANHFGNWAVELMAENFFLTYTNDRSYLNIYIRSKSDQLTSFSLSFVQDLIYNPDNINGGDDEGNAKRIDKLNYFLRNDFEKISELFSVGNYSATKQKIEIGCKEQFKRRHPGM